MDLAVLPQTVLASAGCFFPGLALQPTTKLAMELAVPLYNPLVFM